MGTGSVAGVRPAALLLESNARLREALTQALADSGYDVVLAASPEEALRLVQERSFERIYSDGTLPLTQAESDVQALAGPRVEDRQDGTARVQIDQVVPWSAAMQLLDTLADSSPTEPQRLS